MQFATYYFTLLVMLASVLAAATCFSAYLVSRSRAMILAFGGFLCYFIGRRLHAAGQASPPSCSAPAQGPTRATCSCARWATILIGDACLTFFWLARLRLRGRAVPQPYGGAPHRVPPSEPGAAHGADTPEGRFWFYSLRMIYVFWMLGFGLFRYLTCRDETEPNAHGPRPHGLRRGGRPGGSCRGRGRAAVPRAAHRRVHAGAHPHLLRAQLRENRFSSPAPFWPSATPFARWPCASRSRRPTKATSAPRASATTCSFTHGATA